MTLSIINSLSGASSAAAGARILPRAGARLPSRASFARESFPATRRHRAIAGLLAAVALLALPAELPAVKVGDITRLQGTRTNKILGFGLVMGLPGTGDGGKYLPTMRALARLYENYGVAALGIDELKNAKNVAIVQVEATLPEDGVREGDRVDVQVSSVGGAKSLAGGRLLLTPLLGPNPQDTRVLAMAGGPLQVADLTTPTTARIAQGATLERDFIHNYVALGRDLAVYETRSAGRPLEWIHADQRYVTLVIAEEHAEWAIANTVAQYINEDTAVEDVGGEPGSIGSRVAVAFDPRTVIVRLPATEWENPAPFLGRIENLQLVMPLTESRVIVDHASGTIVVKGDVEISPVVVTHKGLTITTLTADPATAAASGGRATTGYFAPIDPQQKGGARLMDLLESLNQLQVPAEDRIAIIEKLHRLGQLHATLIVDR